MLERHSIQKLHGDERLAVLFVDLVNRTNIGMVQRRSRLRLPLKSGEGLRVSGYFIGQKLEGDKSMQPRVLGLVDNTHPAASELLDNAVVRHDLADHGIEP